MYYFHSRITEEKFRQVIRFFAMDFTASDTAKLTNISVHSIKMTYIKLCKKLPLNVKKYPPFSGMIKLDEFYFDVRGMSSTAAQGYGVPLPSSA